MVFDDDKPTGKDAVMSALEAAAIELILERGTQVSVRAIAEAAGVNHGLVHTYYGSKHGLVAAALDEINRRTSDDLDDEGFPPPDLANRRGGELARVLARMRLEHTGDLFSSHPVIDSWRDALSRRRPDLTVEEVDAMVVTAASLALGWAVFADHLCDAAGVKAEQRGDLDRRVEALLVELGGLPGSSDRADGC